MQRQCIFFGVLITFTFLRYRVQQNRTWYFIQVFQYFDECGQVVAINWSKILKAQFFKHSGWYHHTFHVFFCALGKFHHWWKMSQQFFTAFSCAGVGAA